MLYRAKNCNVKLEKGDMDYISFGSGQKNLVIIPGLGDGIKTVKGTALMIAWMYKKFAKHYKVYVFSRKNQLDPDYSIRDMARDQKEAMMRLGINKAFVYGISQGGMIAQYLAIDYPELVEKLVLVVTLAKQNETVQKVLSSWLQMAEKNDYQALYLDTAEKSYTESFLKKYRRFFPIISKISKPKDLNRFIIQAKACSQHNAYPELERIEAPTLVIGADDDQIVGNNASEEIAAKIRKSQLIIHHHFGHSVYTEVKDFNKQVLEFLAAAG